MVFHSQYHATTVEGNACNGQTEERKRPTLPSTVRCSAFFSDCLPEFLTDTTWAVTGRRRLRVPGRVVMRCGQGRDGSLWLRAGNSWLRIEA